MPNRASGVSATNISMFASRSSPVPSMGSHIGVRIAAGWIELHRTCIPCCAQYSATLLVWLRTAALLDAYAAAAGMPTRPEREDRLMIEPVPVARIARMAYLHPRNTPSRLVSWTARQASSVAFSGSCGTGPPSKPVMPALFTTTSSRPCCRRSALVVSCHPASSRTSRRTKAPDAPRDAATRRPPSTSMSVTHTHAPSSANARAIASPIPRAAPVTSVTLPMSRMRIPSSAGWFPGRSGLPFEPRTVEPRHVLLGRAQAPARPQPDMGRTPWRSGHPRLHAQREPGEIRRPCPVLGPAELLHGVLRQREVIDRYRNGRAQQAAPARPTGLQQEVEGEPGRSHL